MDAHEDEDEEEVMTKQIKLAVGLPHYRGSCSFEHCRMWMEFGAVINESSERFKLVSFALVDECGIDRARNKCMQHAQEADADWLLMIDADTWVSDGGDLLQMISDADKIDATIAGAAVPRRNIDGQHTLMVYAAPVAGELISLTAAGIFNRAAEVEFEQIGLRTLAPVDAMATACMAINLRHAEFLDRPFFRFTNTESEDIDFCRRIREMRGGYMIVDDEGKPDVNGRRVDWHGRILIDKRIEARHLNRAPILRGLDKRYPA